MSEPDEYTSRFVPPNVTKSLIEASIRGRMALAITCLEKYCNSKDIISDWLNCVMSKLWEFVETDRLDEWEYAIQKMTDTVDQMALPKPVVDMLDLIVEEIGCGNLYAGTVGCSWDTLKPTVLVLEIALSEGVAIPELWPFLKSPFSENHGWGNRVDRSFFKTPPNPVRLAGF
jgi:hypothetical protein